MYTNNINFIFSPDFEILLTEIGNGIFDHTFWTQQELHISIIRYFIFVNNLIKIIFYKNFN